MALYEDEGLKLETIFQLQLFILMPERSEKIEKILRMNTQALVDTISPINPELQDIDFKTLKVKILNKLNELTTSSNEQAAHC